MGPFGNSGDYCRTRANLVDGLNTGVRGAYDVPMAELFDTHCHLAHDRLRQQVDDVIARAAAAGVTRMICATGDLTDSKAALSVAFGSGTVLEGVWVAFLTLFPFPERR